MDVNIKMETGIKDNPKNIKKEPELIIECDANLWLPIKLEDEQNDYYQEYCQEFREDTNFKDNIKKESCQEHYTIEYLEENEDYAGENEQEVEEQNLNDPDDLYEPSEDDDDSDNEVEEEEDDVDDDEDEDFDNEGNMNKEYNLQLELYAEDMDEKDKVADGNSSKTNTIFKVSLRDWLLKTYVQHVCPECNEHLAAYKELRKHVQLKHADALEEAQKDYIYSGHLSNCKKCQREYQFDFNRYKHSVRHRENAQELMSKKCKICDDKLIKSIQTHFAEEHPEIVDIFKKSSNNKNSLKCPICHYTYANTKYRKFWHHFMDKHPEEYQERIHYNCHLCIRQDFSEEQNYLQHLMLKHELNSWEVLNFRQLFKNKEYYACLKCHRVYLSQDTAKLLKHYLEHDTTTNWSCKFCFKKSYYKENGRSGHICTRMLQYYNRRHKDVDAAKGKEKKKLQNLQEFEEYIAHVCPFCKEEFNKLQKWQQHLRSIHAIDTLKGLQMQVLGAAGNNKLRCVICHIMVANTPVQLHAHRFLHLPFKPYKCRHCQLTLATFKMALNHVAKRCKDDEDRDYIRQVLKPNMLDTTKSKIEIQCSLCNCQKFSDNKEVFTHYREEHNNLTEFFSLDSGGGNLMSCIVCHNKFSQIDQQKLVEHVYTHIDEKIFKCPLCQMTYAKYKSCVGHIKKIHYFKPIELLQSFKGKAQIGLENKEDKVKADRSPSAAQTPQLAKPSLTSHVLNEFAEFISFACPECNEGMANQEEWHTHITTQHHFFEESNVSFRDSNDTLKCLTCNLNLPTVMSQRLKHKLTHMPYRSFICNLCYARCNSLGVLYGHFRRCHFAQGNFKCAICPVVLATSHQRTEHLKQTHPPHEWPDHLCLICYKILSSKSGLNCHMVTHDADRVKYTCEVCGSKLCERKEFENHIARHVERGEIKQENCDDIPSKSGFETIIPDNMEESRDSHTPDADIKTTKLNVNNKRKSLKNISDIKEIKTELDQVDVKSEGAKVNNKRKSLRNSLATKKGKSCTE